MVFCTEFLDGWWSWEPLHRSCVRCGCCHARQHPHRILIMGRDIQNLIFNLDTISWSILPWFDKNKLIINKDKSLAFSFHHKWNKHVIFPDIILKGRHIMYVSGITFLGVWLGHYLNWDCHVENLIMKLSKLGFAIKTIKSFVNKNIVKTMYFAYYIHLWNMVF